MRRLILVALAALTVLTVATTGHAMQASPGDALNLETHPVLGTWVLQDPRLVPNSPVVLAFSADGSAVQLTVDGAAHIGTWRMDNASSATARLMIPETYLNVLVTVEAVGESLTGSYTTDVTTAGQAGSAATEVQVVDGVRRLTATRVS